MRRMRTRVRLLACLAAAWVSLPAAAAAQPAADQPERPTIRIGPLGVRPRVVLSNVGVDNNVRNERVDPKSDFTFTATPDVELFVNPRRLTLSLLTGTELVYFHTYKSERSTNRSFTTRADLDLTVLRPFASYTSAHTSARTGSEIDVRARHHPRAATAGTRVIIASRTSALVSATRRWDRYNADEVFRGVNLATTLNSDTTAYEAALAVALTPLTSLSLVVVREDTRFELSPLRNSNSIRVGPTLSFSPLGLLSGTASFGYRRFEGESAALPGYSGFVASGTLGLVLGDRFRLDTAFNRDVTYSYETGVPYYVISAGRGTLASRVVGGLDVRVTGGREVMQYRALAGEPSPGNDSVNIYGGGVGYRLGGGVQMSVLAEFRSRHSTRDASREYDNNRIFATLTWGAETR